MYRKLFLALQLAVVIALASCSEKSEEPQLPEPDSVTLISATDVTVPAEGGDIVVSFTANKDWSIGKQQGNGLSYGEILQKSGMAGQADVTFTALPNMTGKVRTTILTISAGRAATEVRISQEPVEVNLPSEEEVKAFLLRLYRDTDGPNWRFKVKWDEKMDKPLSQWGSEVRYENGRLTLNLNERELNGRINLSGCKALVSIRCSKNKISSLDLSDCPLLTEIDCTNSGLEEIKLDGCLSLQHLSLPYNNLKSIDIAWCKTLSDIYIESCRLEALDLDNCVSIKNIKCDNNRLQSLDVPYRENLIDCFCQANEIKKLDLSNSPQFQILNCGENEISELNIKGCPRLRWIYCYDNRLKHLDISDQKNELAHYYCFSNELADIDVSGYYKLNELYCSNNKLTSLKFDDCPNLNWVYCSYNQLEKLTFNGLSNSIFVSLDCSYNRLREADIAALPALKHLWCQGNRIGGEIPAHFDHLEDFEYDVRYDYSAGNGKYMDRGYGWWYPGEPNSLKHSRN